MRIATGADEDAVVSTVVLAFMNDPIWAPALARPDGSVEHHDPFWRPFVVGALRHGTVFVADDGAAVAVWVPPGVDELTEAEESELLALVHRELPAQRAEAMTELWDRFEAARTAQPPHAYLSLLATHPDHRGRGSGQQLLRETLDHWDGLGVPAYLESTNPVNDHRYARAGFTPVGAFSAVVDDAGVTTMWRDVGSGLPRS